MAYVLTYVWANCTHLPESVIVTLDWLLVDVTWSPLEAVSAFDADTYLAALALLVFDW